TDMYAGHFFFQAEDGIRGRNVTGVQTCALPICSAATGRGSELAVHIARACNHPAVVPRAIRVPVDGGSMISQAVDGWTPAVATRSEERRVGKEGRQRQSPVHQREKGREEKYETE